MNEQTIKFSHKIRQSWLSKQTYKLFDFFSSDLQFFVVIALLGIVAWMLPSSSLWASWFGFAISAYGVIANDSIQTLGVFITANAHRSSWLKMWNFIAGVFVVTVGFSWFWFDRDVSFGRLSQQGLEHAGEHVTRIQLILPILLLLLTRLRIPVSTSFFLLSSFASHKDLVLNMIKKSFYAYFSGFVLSVLAWGAFYAVVRPSFSKRPLSKIWFKVQWLTSGLLWSAWLMQDGANMAIFLPKPLEWYDLVLFVFFVLSLLAYFFWSGGGKIQSIVKSKTNITDVRAASCTNAFYMTLLFFFTFISTCPMSTTWLFIGVLGGRELATSLYKHFSYGKPIGKCMVMIVRDVVYVSSGLLISILFTYFHRPYALTGLWEELGWT